MPIVRLKFISVLCLLLSSQLTAQTREVIRVTGTVLEGNSGEPLSDVHITSIGGEFTGTVTNADGTFVLFLPPGAEGLKCSHLGFLTDSILGTAISAPLQILLHPEPYQFDVVTVKPRNPLNVIRRVIAGIPANYPQGAFASHGFYRELIRDSSDFLSIAEATFERSIFPREKSGNRVQLKIKQGRASEEVKATRLFEDFHPAGGPGFLAGLDLSVHRPTFLQEGQLENYEYSIEDLTSYDGRPVFVIGFDQREGVKKSLKRGKMYIDTASAAVISYTSGLSPRGLPFLQHLKGKDKLMAKLLKIEFVRKAFQVDVHFQAVEGKWFLHYGKLYWTVQYQQPKKELDLEFAVASELLISRISSDPPPVIAQKERWDRRQLVINMPTHYRESYWGEDNRIEPSRSVQEVIRQLQPEAASTSQLIDSLNRQWQLQEAYSFSAFAQASKITLQPLTRSLWKNDERGPLLFQVVPGNFELEARVRVITSTDTLKVPNNGFQQGGLMVRNSDTTGVENYVFVSVGTVGNPKIKIAENATRNNKSAIKVRNAPGNLVDLRIIREGEHFSVFTKVPPDEAWKAAGQYQNNLLSGPVQVGLAAFSHFNGNGPKMRPDLLVEFSRIQLINR